LIFFFFYASISNFARPAPKTAAPEPDSLGMGLSVAEMKERLKAKKREAPRQKNKLSFEQKYKAFQKL
jgi:hypothetical protein